MPGFGEIIHNLADIGRRAAAELGNNIDKSAGAMVQRGFTKALESEKIKIRSGHALASGIRETRNEFIQNAHEVVASVNESLPQADKTIAQNVKEKILGEKAPWWKRLLVGLFGNLVQAGASISAHITAGAVNLIGNIPKTSKVEHNDVYNIFTSIFNMAFGKKKEEDEALPVPTENVPG